VRRGATVNADDPKAIVSARNMLLGVIDGHHVYDPAPMQPLCIEHTGIWHAAPVLNLPQSGSRLSPE
jgi:hypothetical protein